MATKGDLTRQNIIEKSMQLFSVKGYFNTSIAGIVKATGLTKGGLYGHFRNKKKSGMRSMMNASGFGRASFSRA